MKIFGIVCLAFVAGIIGGAVSFRVLQSREAAHGTVRAERFELVDADGRTNSYWGKTGTETVLAFLQWPDSHRNGPPERNFGYSVERLTLGMVNGDNSPFFKIYAHDSRPRVRILMNEFERPSLLMEDESTMGLLLGTEQSDTPGLDRDPRPWVLAFGHEGGPRFGIYPMKGGKWGSTLSLPMPNEQYRRWSPF